jgi:hypothetical protein
VRSERKLRDGREVQEGKPIKKLAGPARDQREQPQAALMHDRLRPMGLGELLSLIISGGSALVAVVALVQTRKQGKEQRQIAILQPRLQAYDSAVAIAGQLDRIAQLRFLAKVGSDEVEESHSATGSTKPNHFAEAYDIFCEEFKQQVERLEALRGQSYFPDDFNRAIGSLLAAAATRNGVGVEVVHHQWNDIRENLQRLRAIHTQITR